MPVITMTQEMATLGKDVALGVCEELGLEQVRHEIGDIVAGRMHVKKSLIRRLREGKANTIERWAADEKTISIFTAEEIFDLAVKGNVLIRGWGATLWLRPVAHIPAIKVCSPMELRVKRLMARLETDDENLARKEIRVDDAARAARMSEHFDVEWGDPSLLDLTMNTERIPVSSCVDMVVALTRSAAFTETPESRQHLLDLALATHVRAALRAHADTSHVDVTVVAEKGTVILSGIVSNPKERDQSTDVAGAVAGVTRVDNQLGTMTGRPGARIFPSGSVR
ncbi:MAG: cytidylate kinase family protein [Betaproteobacteria bacterium]|nr:cytidylate kinase family protein [Betaproteobacteria bacterium]